MRVLCKVEGMVGAAQGALEVAQHGVDRAELWQCGTGLAASGDDTLVCGTHDLDCAETPQAVGDDRGRRGDGASRKYRHLLAGEWLLAQAHELRLAVGGGLHGSDERHFVLGATSDLAARALTAEVGIVDLHPTVELAALLAHAHDLHELVLDEPGGLVANPQVALEFEGGDVVLGLREQVHGQEPARQRQLGRLEDRAADHAALVPAAGALEVQAPLTAKRTALGAAARRAGKASRPARFDQRRLALVIAAVKVHKLGHRKSGLKLHSVHRHGSPPVLVSPSSIPTGSQDEPAEVRR